MSLAQIDNVAMDDLRTRLAAQSIDIRRLAWGLELGVPTAALRAALVTPWT